MKLLKKSQIIEKQNSERKSVIDSGLVLAKKVDALRQDMLSLEKQRNDFIRGSQEQLEATIGNLKNQKIGLEKEIEEQKKILTKLREPLDEEWIKLNNAKEDLVKLQSESDIFMKNLIAERSELENNKKKIQELLKKATITAENAEKALHNAQENKKNTQINLYKVQKIRETKEVEIYEKEIELFNREKSLNKKQEQFKKDFDLFMKEKQELELKKARWKI